MLIFVCGKILLQYVKQSWPELQVEIDKSSNVVRDFNVTLSVSDKSSRHNSKL